MEIIVVVVTFLQHTFGEVHELPQSVVDGYDPMFVIVVPVVDRKHEVAHEYEVVVVVAARLRTSCWLFSTLLMMMNEDIATTAKTIIGMI